MPGSEGGKSPSAESADLPVVPLPPTWQRCPFLPSFCIGGGSRFRSRGIPGTGVVGRLFFLGPSAKVCVFAVCVRVQEREGGELARVCYYQALSTLLLGTISLKPTKTVSLSGGFRNIGTDN